MTRRKTEPSIDERHVGELPQTGDRYVTDAIIGAGGMGVVYRGRDTLLGREVAIKRLTASAIGDLTAQQRLLREAKSVARLSHPGVVQVHDVVLHDDGTISIVMELIDGQTLADLTPSGGAPVAEVLKYLEEVAGALTDAHESGIVHRDLKPQNIMIDRSGRARVLDFGLSKVWRLDRVGPDDSTVDVGISEQASFAGTVGYFSPEQLLMEPVTPRSDQYQLALVAHELLTGHLPWSGTSSEELLMAPLRESPRSVSSTREDVDPRVDAVLARALSRDPGQRYPSVDSFVRELCRAAAGRVSFVAPKRPSWVSVDPRGRWTLPVGLMLGACSLLGFIVATQWARPHPLASDDAVLACPIFSIKGVAEPNGWLGAAAASYACERAVWELGGTGDRVLLPGQLLGLPRLPADDFPAEPYEAPTAKPRSMTAAKERATARVDGSLERLPTGWYRAVVAVTSSSDVPLGDPASAEAKTPWAAVSGAVAKLAKADGRGGLPDGIPLAPSIAEWFASRSAAIEEVDLGESLHTSDAVTSCRALADDMGHPMRRAFAAHCEQWGVPLGEDAPHKDPLPRLAAAEPSRLYREVRGYIAKYSGSLEKLDQRATALASDATSPGTRSAMFLTASNVRAAMGDVDRALDAAMRAIDASPSFRPAWESLVVYGTGRWGSDPMRRAYAAWVPGFAPAWCSAARTASGTRRLEFTRRCYLLSPGTPAIAMYYADELLKSGRPIDALALTATLDERSYGVASVAPAYIRARVWAFDGEFDRALDTLATAQLAVERLGGRFYLNGDGRSLVFLLELAALSERGRESIARLVDKFVASSNGLEKFSLFSAGLLASLCLAGGEPHADSCREQMSELSGQLLFSIPGSREYYDAVIEWLGGDGESAIAKWNGTLDEYRYPLLSPNVAAEQLLVRSVHRRDLARTDYHGFHLAHYHDLVSEVLEGASATSRAAALSEAWRDRGVRSEIMSVIQTHRVRMQTGEDIE